MLLLLIIVDLNSDKYFHEEFSYSDREKLLYRMQCATIERK